jgi:hypothetical protein
MCERCEDLGEALRRIVHWSAAYPIDVFHEPSPEECRRAHRLLKDNGMTLDAFSAAWAAIVSRASVTSRVRRWPVPPSRPLTSATPPEDASPMTGAGP